MMARKKYGNGVDTGMLAAKEALHEAARTIARLAREEPRLRRVPGMVKQKLSTGNPKLETMKASPSSRQCCPATLRTEIEERFRLSPDAAHPRTENHISIHPTGHHETDVRNIEEAIEKAGPGGTVLLKANGKDGKPCSFNLTMVTDLTLPYEISLKSEKNAQIRFSESL